MKKLPKNSVVPLIVAGVVFVCFLVGGLLHVLSLRGRSLEQSVQYVGEATNLRADAVEQQVRGDLQVLRGVAISLSAMDLSDAGGINAILDSINQTNTFVRMGLADTAGKVDLLDLDGTIYEDVDLSGYDFFQTALAGEDPVSATFHAPWSDEDVNYYAVPVRQDGILAGVLCAAETDAIFRSLLSAPVFQGEGYFAIIDDAGVLVAPSSDPRPEVELGESILDFVTLTPEERATLMEALSKREGADLTFTFGGEAQLASLAPLSFNDWFIISVVPRDAVYSYYNTTAVGTTILLILAFAIFLFLLFLQLRSSAKGRKDLEYLAYTDLLTGERNYQKFLLDAAALLAEKDGRKYAVWSHDIKKFYAINDVFGHATGDLVLRRMAAVFAAREDTALFCRVGADNFAGILPYFDKRELEEWYAGVIAALARREIIPENQMHIDDAMGIYCIADFADELSVDEMVTHATVAKRSAKEGVGNTLAFFTQEMSVKLMWETELEAAGRQALDEGQITFFLQPKVSIQQDYRISGAEALARWNHPRHGRIPPDEFIPLFEENGFIVEMDRAIFERVCQWYVQNLRDTWPGTRLAVNVSRQGLMREDFVEHYALVKEKYAIADDVLELEFTESVVFSNDALFQDTVLALRKKGFICSIDDFGSGYSSLNVLKNLPISVLKLDAAFFRHSQDVDRERAVVAGFLALAHKLSILTVAEGVETHEQVAFLREAGCDIVQGYVFAKPMPKEEYLALLESTGGILTLGEA